METKEKEVWFWMYCKHCALKNKSEEHPTCSDCLSYPSNQDSHKPVNYLWDGIGEEPVYNSMEERKNEEG